MGNAVVVGRSMIASVACADTQGLIGLNGVLPWRQPSDLAHFRRVTINRAVIMGRRTWASLPPAVRPLPQRVNIVVSTTLAEAPPGAHLCRDLDSAIRAGQRVCLLPRVIGGAALYAAAMPRCCAIYLTRLPFAVAIPDGAQPTYFPPIPPGFSLVSTADLGDGARVEHWIRRSADV